MTKKEFISRLKENKKEFKDTAELVDYMLPVLQYYLENYQPVWYDADTTKLNTLVDFSKIIILKPDNPRRIQEMQIDFHGLIKRVEEFE